MIPMFTLCPKKPHILNLMLEPTTVTASDGDPLLDEPMERAVQPSTGAEVDDTSNEKPSMTPADTPADIPVDTPVDTPPDASILIIHELKNKLYE